jgi:hypothetical protein
MLCLIQTSCVFLHAASVARSSYLSLRLPRVACCIFTRCVWCSVVLCGVLRCVLCGCVLFVFCCVFCCVSCILSRVACKCI